MAKLSITLPNNTQITLESEESSVIQDVISLVLRDVPLDSALANLTTQGDAGVQGVQTETGRVAVDIVAGQAVHTPVPPPRRINGAAPGAGAVDGQMTMAPMNGAATNGSAAPTRRIGGSEGSDVPFNPSSYPPHTQEDFVAFCQSVTPIGDMRRVVVAAEAAHRFFGLEGVTADDLGELFDLAGWRRANSFTQTLRNSARSKYGWLERIPGSAGRYAATDSGRHITLSG